MLLVLRGLWAQYRPARRGEDPHAYAARRYPHVPKPLWTDGTD